MITLLMSFTKKASSFSLVAILFFLIKVNQVSAQTLPAIDPLIQTAFAETSTTAATIASPAGQIEQKILEKTEQDITQSSQTQKSKLATFLDENQPGALSWNNFLRYSIFQAVNKGLPPNIVVLVLLFPLIASLIAVSRHLIGLEGFGIYIPAVLAVAFVSTGVLSGVLIFLAVFLAAIITRQLLQKFRMPYLPRTAMLLLGVSVMILGLLLLATFANLYQLLTVNIFPLLIIMLLTENFMDSQLFNNQTAAVRLTLETLFIAIACSLIIGSDFVQQQVLIKPELTLIIVGSINLIIGKYKGLRLFEYLRFRPLLEQ